MEFPTLFASVGDRNDRTDESEASRIRKVGAAHTVIATILLKVSMLLLLG